MSEMLGPLYLARTRRPFESCDFGSVSLQAGAIGEADKETGPNEKSRDFFNENRLLHCRRYYLAQRLASHLVVMGRGPRQRSLCRGHVGRLATRPDRLLILGAFLRQRKSCDERLSP